MLGIPSRALVDDRWLRHHPKVLAFEFAPEAKRPDKANVIDLYVSGRIPETASEKQQYEATFKTVPEPLTAQEREEFLKKLDGVACSSDAFFPFPDNVHRLAKVLISFAVLIIVWSKVHSRPRWKCPGQNRARDCRCIRNGIRGHRHKIIHSLNIQNIVLHFLASIVQVFQGRRLLGNCYSEFAPDAVYIVRISYGLFSLSCRVSISIDAP